MKTYYRSTAIVFVLLLFFTVSAECQTYGKIFAKSEADRTFGDVNYSIMMSVSDLNELINKTNNVLMFRIKDGNLVVLGDKRKLLYPSSAAVAASDVYEVFSKSIITELLNKGGTDIVNIEQRKSVLTVTCGDYTLEQGIGCPPWCG